MFFVNIRVGLCYEKRAAAAQWCSNLQYFGIRINNVCVCVESSLSSGESCQQAGNTVTRCVCKSMWVTIQYLLPCLFYSTDEAWCWVFVYGFPRLGVSSLKQMWCLICYKVNSLCPGPEQCDPILIHICSYWNMYLYLLVNKKINL